MADAADPADEADEASTTNTSGSEPERHKIKTRDAAITVTLAILRAVVTVGLVLLFYAWLPTEVIQDRQVVLLVTTGAMVLWGVAVVILVLRIGNKPNALIRVTSGLLTVIVLLVAVFAQIDLLISSSDPGAYSQPLDKTAALYFSMTVTATVGFGDIVAVSDPARHVVTFQMLIDMVFLAAAIKGVLGAAQVSHRTHPDERPPMVRKHAERQEASQKESQSQ